ncbi:MAG: PKD domain-containing protein [Phycisphaerae bacterium]|nr:PKD domain-containing protein [Saprospiraceae bacterium]
MAKFLRLYCCYAAISFLLFSGSQLGAQSFTASLEPYASLSLSQQFSNFQVFKLDASTLDTYVKSNADAPAQLKVGTHDWRLELTVNPIVSEYYSLQVHTPQGTTTSYPKSNIAFKGYELNGGGRVRLAMNGEFLYGFVEEGLERYYIEPLWYYIPSASHDLFVLYPKSAVIPITSADACGVTQEQMERHRLEHEAENGAANKAGNSACYELEIAIASDRKMFDKYGSVGAVQDHNIAVINDVQVDYTGNFNHDLSFNIVTQFVVSGTDPWTQSTDAGTLLDDFRTWGNNGGFGVSFDNGELWTNRDFNGGTVGIAYLGGICNNAKYHCLQDFTGNAEHLRCMTSHELGHNFTAAHDAPNSGFIMAPSVSNSTTWSDASQGSINGYMQNKINSGCLSACGPPPPPLVAGFDWSPNPGCQNQPVSFTDLSTGNITAWAWAFPGGVPSSSNQQNPTVTWATPGTKSVSLTVSGQGNPNSITQSVEITALPVANFTFSVNGLIVTFTNTSTNATSYEWDFGDGGFSTDANPVYEYPVAGTYVVLLKAINSCGQSTKSLIINTAPSALFEASPTNGCTPLVVTMNNQSSSNSVTYVWSFPGGAPSASNQTNPTVVYTLAGTYSITLKATNGSGSSTFTRTDYITVKTTPAANFNFTVNGSTATFTNTTIGTATSYLWDFGDGGTSALANPVHTYAAPGNYIVVLTATNECGSTTKSKPVEIIASSAPTASFTANPSSGCIPYNPVPAYDHIVIVVGGKANSDAVFGNPSAPYINSLANNGAKFSNSNAVFDQSQPNYLALYSGSNQGITNDNLINTVFTTANLGRELIDAQKSYLTYSEGLPSVGFNGAFSGNYFRSHNPAANWMGVGTNQIPATTNRPFTAFPVNFDSLPNVAFVVPDQCSGGHDVCPPLNNSVKQFDNWIQNNLDAYKQWCVNHNSLLIVTYDENASSGNTKIATVFYGAHVANGDYGQTINHYNVLRTIEEACRLSAHAGAAANAIPIDNCWTPAATPLTVNFSNNSTGAVSYSWDFPGGNPATSTATTPTVAYSNPGVYTVTLTATNANGSSTTTSTITVNTVPTPGFTYAIGSNDTTVAFTNTSAGATSYLWTFGDGDSSTSANPIHDYPSYDSTYIYQVIMRATNDCGTVNDTQLVKIVTNPKANFTATPANGCAPLIVQFNNSSTTNSTSFLWEFPGGTPNSSTLQNPVVVYLTAGTYSATLIAINSSGRDTFSRTNYIVVNTTPSTGFTSAANSLTVTFTNTTTGATSYAWDFGDGGNSSAVNPSHTYANDGTYTVILSATNACGTTTKTQSVTVASTPSAGFTASTNAGCAPLTVQFTNTSSSNASAYDWQFPGGNPSSSTAQNPPSVEYALPGTYTVTLTVSNAAGSSTATRIIVVSGGPTANFTSTVSVLTATFTNASSNSLSYNWDFGDGNSSTNPNPTHGYAADGTYTVVLTASNNCGTSTFTQNVIINTEPGAGFSASTSSGCAVLTVNFADISSGNPVSWEWDFPGGTPSSSTDENPTVQYFTPGVYDVTLVVTSIGGSTDSFTQPGIITVNGAPSAGFISSVNGSIATFTNTSVNATSYIWNFGDGSNSTSSDPTHTYANDGVYNVTLTASNNCGGTIFEQTVTIVTPPTANFTTSASAGCTPFTVQFTNASSSNATTYAWEFPGGNPPASTQENPIVAWNTPGVYVVTLTASNAAGSSTSTTTITVGTTPTAGFTYQIGGLTAVFNNISINGNSYSWDFGDGSAASTEANPSHDYAQVGSYQVTLSATNDCGTVTFTQTVVVQGSPPVPKITANNTTGCLPFSVQFTDESAGEPTVWSWTFLGGTPGTSTDQNPLVSYSAPGTYEVVLVVTNIFGTATQSFPAYITVQPTPTANFTFAASQTTVAFTSTSQNATSFAWNFGDGNTSNEENPTHTYTAPGTYTVSLVATNNCGTGIYQQTIVITSGTGEAAWIQNFRLFPNPNTGVFNVEMNGLPQDEVEFVLFNALGQQIKRETADFGTGSMLRSFDYGDLAAGVYTLRVQANGQAMFVKVAVGR